jgi:cob(I)alamin adenosyltransferase
LNDSEKLELKEDVEKEFQFCKRVLREEQCHVLIMDEIMGTIKNGLLKVGDVVNMMKNKPKDIELIMTGRDAPEEVIEAADLVTEMREIKHYFNEGIAQRKGIEY